MKRLVHNTEGPLRGLALGIFYILLATMIRGLMGGTFTFVLYWFYLGIASMVYRLYKEYETTQYSHKI